MFRFSKAVAAFAAMVVLPACTTTQSEFAANPRTVPKVNICRTYLETPDPYFRQKLAQELGRRGISPYECPGMVQQQNNAAAALVAVAAVGGAVAYCSRHNCGGEGGYYRPPAQYPGNCRYDGDIAADGSRCGHRSAQSRPGGW